MISRNEVQEEFSRLARAQRHFEAKDPGSEEHLREAIATTRRKLAEWERAGEYFYSEVQLLRGTTAYLSELLKKPRQ